jgi:hypothetical protein
MSTSAMPAHPLRRQPHPQSRQPSLAFPGNALVSQRHHVPGRCGYSGQRPSNHLRCCWAWVRRGERKAHGSGAWTIKGLLGCGNDNVQGLRRLIAVGNGNPITGSTRAMATRRGCRLTRRFRAARQPPRCRSRSSRNWVWPMGPISRTDSAKAVTPPWA